MELVKKENSFDLLYAEAEKLSQADLLPADYRGKPANVLIARDIANRMGVSLFEVTQNLNIIKGRPTWGSQFIIQRVNLSGKYATSINYDWVGERDKPSWGCAAYVITKDKQKLKGATITMEIAEKEGWTKKLDSKTGKPLVTKWQTFPEQMLMYRAAAFFCRTYCPEVMFGLQTKEEVIDVEAVQQTESRFASDTAEPTPPPPPPQIEAQVCDEKPAKDLFAKDAVKETVPAGL